MIMQGAIKGTKLNNRKFPGIFGRRPDQKERRVAVAAYNLERWSKLTPQQKIADLDKRLGKGVGAVMQRAKLNALINS